MACFRTTHATDAEHDDVTELDPDGTAGLWELDGPRDLAFRPEWVAGLLSEHRALDHAPALATATVNHWERGPRR